MKLLYCNLVANDGAVTIMILRAHLEPMDALHYCAQLGFPVNKGEFSCWKVPDDMVELFAEHAERVLTAPKAQELFGDKWRAGSQS